jgi:hypothetical protein
MKTFRSKRGPFAEQPFFTDTDLESICADELRKHDLLPARPEPIRIERFVEKRFKVNVEPMNLGEGVLGLTKFGPSGVVGIYVSETLETERSKISERRVRSTIAHEAGHGLLHTHLFALSNNTPLFGDFSDPETPKVLCREDRLDEGRKQYGGEWWEFQANAAMGHLLMPRVLVEDAVRPFLITVGHLGGKEIDPDRYDLAVRSLAETFDVNPAVSRIRLEAYYPVKANRQMML